MLQVRPIEIQTPLGSCQLRLLLLGLELLDQCVVAALGSLDAGVRLSFDLFGLRQPVDVLSAKLDRLLGPLLIL